MLSARWSRRLPTRRTLSSRSTAEVTIGSRRPLTKSAEQDLPVAVKSNGLVSRFGGFVRRSKWLATECRRHRMPHRHYRAVIARRDMSVGNIKCSDDAGGAAFSPAQNRLKPCRFAKHPCRTKQ